MAQRQSLIKSVAVVGGLISLLAVATYPVIIDPKLHPEKFRKSSNSGSDANDVTCA